MRDDRRPVTFLLAMIGVGLLAAVLVMVTLRAGQATNTAAIEALQDRAVAAEATAERAQADAEAARAELRELTRLVQALEDQVRSMGGVPVTTGQDRSATPRPEESTAASGGRPAPADTARPSASPTPAPSPQPTPTQPEPSPSPSGPLCVLGLCLPEV